MKQYNLMGYEDQSRLIFVSSIFAVNLNNAPDLRAIRKRLKPTQAEAVRIFGGGITAFSHYERGEIKPPAEFSGICSSLS